MSMLNKNLKISMFLERNFLISMFTKTKILNFREDIEFLVRNSTISMFLVKKSKVCVFVVKNSDVFSKKNRKLHIF